MRIYRFFDVVFGIKFNELRAARFFKAYECDDKPVHIIEFSPEQVAAAIDEFKCVDAFNAEILLIHKALCLYILENCDGFIFHSSAIAFDGKGVLFAAPSGTGKSTHAAHWKNVFGDRVSYINDDKPFIRLIDGEFYVYGSPWSGKHRLGENVRVPLKAVCFLKRGEVDRLVTPQPFEIISSFFPQTMMPSGSDLKIKLFDLLSKLVNSVKVRVVYCTDSDASARIINEALEL